MTLSNRSVASGQRRRKRTLNGGGSIDLYVSMHRQAQVSKLGASKAGSRIPTAWNDHVRMSDVPVFIAYSPEYMRSLAIRPAFINTKRMVENKATLRTWDGAKHKTVTKRIDLSLSLASDPNRDSEWYQAPADEYVKRGEATLFDWCVVIPKPAMARRWQPIGELPPYQVTARKPSSLKLEADEAYLTWKGAKQQAHYDALVCLSEGR